MIIGRVVIGNRKYEIELAKSRAILRRITPPGESVVRHDMNTLYNFATETWDATEVQRVLRSLERQGLFDTLKPPASAGKESAP